MANDDATTKPTHTNRLSEETSPYLLQHAHNPVDWYPLVKRPLQPPRLRASRFFSAVGYSTCYWVPRDGTREF